MAVVMLMQFEGITPDQYEKVRKTVNWEGDRPKGATFHVAAFGDGKLHVTDIWASAEDFQKFVDGRLMPGLKSVGVPGQPNVQVFPLHAVYNPGVDKL